MSERHARRAEQLEVVYWSDQWKEKAGSKKFDKAGLDAEVANVTQYIWKTDPRTHLPRDEKYRPNTKVTLWRLK